MAVVVITALAVLALNLYALALIVLRGVIFRTRIYRPMVLNIGLSLLPVVVALALVLGALLLASGLGRLAVTGGHLVLWVFLIITAMIWILFFPNAMYLITELNLSHRRSDDRVPLWFDIVQTLTLTLSGVANAMASLALVQLFAVLLFADPNADLPWPPALSWVFAVLVLALGALGMYLGRYLRFNSWDVRHPSSMISKTTSYFSTRTRIADCAAFVVTHTILIGLLYVPLFTGAYRLLLAG